MLHWVRIWYRLTKGVNFDLTTQTSHPITWNCNITWTLVMNEENIYIRNIETGLLGLYWVKVFIYFQLNRILYIINPRQTSHLTSQLSYSFMPHIICQCDDPWRCEKPYDFSKTHKSHKDMRYIDLFIRNFIHNIYIHIWFLLKLEDIVSFVDDCNFSDLSQL